MRIGYKTAKSFAAPITRHWLNTLVNRTRPLWFELGKAEAFFLREKLSQVPITSPIYVMGLARAGTTTLLEALASCPGTASHRYQDFPLIPIPSLWRSYLKRFSYVEQTPKERTHFDGMLVTSASPEAFEEMLWMHFFPEYYTASSILEVGEQVQNAPYENFYRNHIRKLLLTEHASRYLAKGNYNLGRLGYLHKLYPDARFIVAVRNPSSHIASLIKQHRMFCDMQAKDHRLLAYMRQAGHFEFGLDRRTLQFSNQNAADAVHNAWRKGDEVTGWALYWDSIYSEVARLMKSSPKLAQNILVVPYESLCDAPIQTLEKIARHCRLEFTPEMLEHWRKAIVAPTYYTAEYTNEESNAILEHTQETARFFGYAANAAPVLTDARNSPA